MTNSAGRWATSCCDCSATGYANPYGRPTSSHATGGTSSWWWRGQRTTGIWKGSLSASSAPSNTHELAAAPSGLSASAGLAHPYPADTPETILARADTAMFTAKIHGDGLPHVMST